MKFVEEGFIERNKKLFFLAFAIFMIVLIAGAIYAFMTVGDQYGMISKAYSSKGLVNPNLNLGLTTGGLFLHNFTADLIEIFGGLLFSIISIIVVALNAFSIGTMFGADFTFAIPSILPHGIVEYSASVFGLTAAFLLTKLEILMIKNRSFMGTIRENKVILKDFLVFFVLVVVLLLIAAFIEANITQWVVFQFFGLN